MVQKHLQQLVQGGSYFHPESEWVGSNQYWRNYETIQIMVMIVLVGGKTATASWTFDRDHPGYAGQFILDWYGLYWRTNSMAQSK